MTENKVKLFARVAFLLVTLVVLYSRNKPSDNPGGVAPTPTPTKTAPGLTLIAKQHLDNSVCVVWIYADLGTDRRIYVSACGLQTNSLVVIP